MDCYQKAAQLLAGRPHFRAQLAAKLAQRGFPEDDIAAALDRLQSEGWIDDERTAADFVAHRRERGGEGRVRLRAELVRRGAPAAAVESALAGLGEEDDLAAASAAAARWTRTARRAEPAALARRLAQHLARKGFSRRAIVAALNERPGGSADLDQELAEDPAEDADDEDTAFDFEPE